MNGRRGTGHHEHIELPFDRLPEYDPKTREHCWIMICVYRFDPAKAEDPSYGPMIFDSANLLSAGKVGCFFCEEGYEKRLTFRPCPGDPS